MSEGGGRINRKIVFGTERNEAESLGTSTTTSQTLQQKLRMTTEVLEGGQYMFGVSGAAGNESKSKTTLVRLQLDDVTNLGEILLSNSDQDNWFVTTGGTGVVTLSAGIHTLDVDFGCGSEVDVAQIRTVRLYIFRWE